MISELKTDRKRVVGVIQARMSSKRLPGKVLMSVNGKPLLGHLIDRINCCENLDGFVIATSDTNSDNEIEEFSKKNNISVYRGQLNDVAKRLINAAHFFNADAIVRINGDSPLIDYKTIDELVEHYKKTKKVDIVTNVQERTFPKGQSVEVINIKSLINAYESEFDEYEKEHVTPWFYKNCASLNLLNIKYKTPCGNIQLSVDSEADMKKFEKIISVLGEPYHSHSLDSILKAEQCCRRDLYAAT